MEHPDHYAMPKTSTRNFRGHWPLSTSKMLLDLTSTRVAGDVASGALKLDVFPLLVLHLQHGHARHARHARRKNGSDVVAVSLPSPTVGVALLQLALPAGRIQLMVPRQVVAVDDGDAAQAE